MARHFSLLTGWSASYPEVTGYIIPTLYRLADRLAAPELEQRARRALDWLVSIQMDDGGFQGGMIGAEPRVPVVFNTGQILLGLASGVSRLGDRYRPCLRAAADWLVDAQDSDGGWSAHASPFARPESRVYDAHVAWGLFEAARVDPERGYAEAAHRCVRWALSHQRDNGWFDDCCLTDPDAPLTHTLGYALRGVLEAYRQSGETDLLTSARLAGEGMLCNLAGDGFLPGRFRSDWRGIDDWVCLTGSSQVALCWMQIFEAIGDRAFLDGARSVNAFVRRTMAKDLPPGRHGAIKGSFPVDGHYGRFEYLSWATKFMVDAQLAEERLAELCRAGEPAT